MLRVGFANGRRSTGTTRATWELTTKWQQGQNAKLAKTQMEARHGTIGAKMANMGQIPQKSLKRLAMASLARWDAFLMANRPARPLEHGSVVFHAKEPLDGSECNQYKPPRGRISRLGRRIARPPPEMRQGGLRAALPPLCGPGGVGGWGGIWREIAFEWPCRCFGGLRGCPLRFQEVVASAQKHLGKATLNRVAFGGGGRPAGTAEILRYATHLRRCGRWRGWPGRNGQRRPQAA